MLQLRKQYGNSFLHERCEAVCHLVAKAPKKRGCYALKTTHGKHLVELKRTLNAAVRERGIQLVTISRPTAYGEYAPYTFAKSEEEFRDLVEAM